MEEKKVTPEVQAEVVEQPQARPEKTFTQAEVDKIVKERVAREQAKAQKQPAPEEQPAPAPEGAEQPEVMPERGMMEQAVEQIKAQAQAQIEQTQTQLAEANKKLVEAQAKLECSRQGVIPNAIDDAVILALNLAKTDGEVSEESIAKYLKEVLARHPEWKDDETKKNKTGFKVGVDAYRESSSGDGKKPFAQGKVIF